MTPGIEPLEVILDVDTGVDDALAILLACAAPAVSVRAISCVAGNVAVDQVVVNTLKVLDGANAPQVPVAKGMAGPLAGNGIPPRGVHGADGMADLGLPASTRPVSDRPGVDLLEHALNAAAAPVTLVALGPLTNIGSLLRAHPDVRSRIDRILVVGGPVDEPVAGRVDFNLHHDPSAAAIVLASGVPVLTYGLDVLSGVALSSADIARLAQSRRRGARLAAALAAFQVRRFGGRGVLGDAGAVAALLAPDATSIRSMNATVDVVASVDAPGLRAMFLDALDPAVGRVDAARRLR